MVRRKKRGCYLRNFIPAAVLISSLCCCCYASSQTISFPAFWNPSFTVLASSAADDDHVGRDCAADVLALLGGKEAAASVNASRSHQLLSQMCFLVPLQAVHLPTTGNILQSLTQKCESQTKKCNKPNGLELLCQDSLKLRDAKEMQRLIHFPPLAVAELAKKAVAWAGEPEAVVAELGSTLYQVPDWEDTVADQCQLTKYTFGKRFAVKELNNYMAFLFKAIQLLGPSVGFNVSLSRYDLFHGHMFTAYKTGRLGILFHSREYPEFDKNTFPINLGYCQRGSPVPYDVSMNLRNILWLAPMPACSGHQCSNDWLAPGALIILDAHPKGVFYNELVPEWVDIVRTIYEDDFGSIVVDVNHINLENVAPEARIFLC